MKGFIEVTEIYNGNKDIVSINIKCISEFKDKIIVKTSPYKDGSYHLIVKQSYEEIKELIKQAQ